MQLGVIGLGRMGGSIARRLMQGGHQCVVFDHNPEAVDNLVGHGGLGAKDLADLSRQLEPRRTVWVMLPAGKPTEDTIAALGEVLQAGDIIIDGGNTFYRDDIRRTKALEARGLAYVDVGTSGGVWGLERGFCMTVGGERNAVERIEPILKTLAPGIGQAPRTRRREDSDPRAEQGYIHAGPAGAGHFVKMVHNGIEYGLMQAYAEGFDILKNAARPELRPPEEQYEFKLAEIAEVWRRGSVISSWLLDLTAAALAGDPKLDSFEGIVEDSGAGRWTVAAAIEEAVPVNVISAALYARFRSRENPGFADKMLSAMRRGFGGHAELKSGGSPP
jgi:6-phosphogluconate dehydrogenase